MKIKFIMLSIVLLINLVVYSQKNQIKNAQTQFKDGDFQAALKTLNASEYLIINATDDEKSEFYFLKGNILKWMAENNIEASKNLSLASDAYQELIKNERDSEKFKYTLKADTALKEIKAILSKEALADFKANKFKESSEKSYSIYLLDKKDTLHLFNAASSSMAGKDYNTAIKYYLELKKLNYSGIETHYYAFNKKTKEEDNFTSSSERDINIKAGTHNKPRNEVSLSKKNEINKNLAFIYVERQDFANAEIYYNKVLEMTPNYIDAYINLSYLILESKRDIVDKMNNLGNTPAEIKLYDELKIKKDNIVKSAIPYLKKALAIEPKNKDVLKSLMNVYKSLDMDQEYNALKGNM